MDENVTSNVSLTNSKKLDVVQVIVNGAYIVTGSTTTISNFVIILLFLLYKSLRRKELLILFGLVVGDFLGGVSFCMGGARRLDLVLKGEHTRLVTPWSCQKEPATFLYICSPQISALMNLAISMDRLVCVAWPNVYKLFTILYVFIVTGCVFSYVLLTYIIGVILSSTLSDIPTISAMCLGPQTSWPSFGTFYTTVIALATCGSVLVYCFVMGILKYRLNHASEATHDIQEKRQKSVTKTLAIVSFTDFLFDVIPWFIQTIVSVLHLSSSISILMAPITYIFIQTNRTIRVVIYICMLKDIRKAFMHFISCKITHINQVSTVTRNNH